MNDFYNKHYVTIDVKSCINDGWSDGPHPERDTSEAICINGKGGYQFRLYPGGEENPALYTMDRIPMYMWDGEKVVRRTKEEIEADRAAIPATLPTKQEQTRADADFLKEFLEASIKET